MSRRPGPPSTSRCAPGGGVAAATGQAYPDDQTLASRGVAAEQMVGVPPHPAQPPDRYALPVQGGPDQTPEAAGERARAAVHVFEYRPKAALSGRAEDGEGQLPDLYQPTAPALAAWQSGHGARRARLDPQEMLDIADVRMDRISAGV